MKKVPFDCSYWVIPGKFLAGCYPGSMNQDEQHQRLRGLLDHGIRHVINLMETDEQDWRGEPFASYEDQLASIAASIDHVTTFERTPIKDTLIPSRVEMCRILDRIDQCIQDGKAVFVHCMGGRGRTGTVVGCFLVRHGFASGPDVIDRISELRRNTADHYLPSPETPQQYDFVLSWIKGE
jgi:protein tyrosine phosphatase